MKAEILLPILTLGLGWGLAQVTEVLREHRTTTRERLARRAELQRTTLLELQDTLAELWRGALGNAIIAIAMLKEEEQEQTPWKSMVEPSHNLAATRRRVRLLASRVEDERVRELSAAVDKASGHISSQSSEYFEDAGALANVEEDYSAAVARIGELLRERY